MAARRTRKIKEMPAGKCTHFRCESCEKIFEMSQQHIVRVEVSCGGNAGQREYRYYPFWCAICDKCFEDGKGIGLAVVRRIVDDYKGKIKVVSEPNKGTEIFITLPIEERKLSSRA